MGRIKRTEVSRDGQCINLGIDFVDFGQNAAQVERFLFLAKQVVPTCKVEIMGCRKAAGQFKRINEIWVITNQEQGHPLALAFGNRDLGGGTRSCRS